MSPKILSTIFAEQSKILLRTAKYIPSGIIEPAIAAVGNGKYRIINLQPCNKAGKTAAGAAIIANIAFEHDQEYFDYPLFKEWPFLDNSGNVIKSGRIVGTKENVTPGGPIETEIMKWFPRGRYETVKHGHSSVFAKEIKTDTGWTIDILSHEQKREQHEGPLKSFIWSDEPCKPEIIGAITSRFSRGGIWLLTNTPIGAGPMLDCLDDLEAKGASIIHIYGTMQENDSETGKPNSKGTRRGLMTPQQIAEYIRTTPTGEEEARLEGKANYKSGKVYKTFDRGVHCSREYDLGSSYAKTWNNYNVMDPHRSFYPAMGWFAITPEEDVVIWNEWPTVKTMSGKFYDEIRDKIHSQYTIPDQCEVIKIMDSTSIGMAEPLKRFIDPRFAAATKNEWTKDTAGIIEEFAKPGRGIRFEMPPFERIDVQKQRIHELLRYDAHTWRLGGTGAPRLWVMPWCYNFIRALERHYYEDGSETEAEDYKDFIDLIRYFLAGVGEIRWKETRQTLPSERFASTDAPIKKTNPYQNYLDSVRRID